MSIMNGKKTHTAVPMGYRDIGTRRRNYVLFVELQTVSMVALLVVIPCKQLLFGRGQRHFVVIADEWIFDTARS